MKKIRLYADTSVFGGCFDKEFSEASLELFDEIRKGVFTLLLSPTTLDELAKAPQEIRKLLDEIREYNVETIDESDEIKQLRDAYMKAGIVGSASIADAEHIASASVADADLIVSWNFKHIVHFDKIKQYHAVNLMQGYRSIPIHTPREVVKNEREGI